MVIEKQPFRAYKLDEEKGEDEPVVIPTKWNKEELGMLMDGGLRIGQPKKSTIIKMLAKIGYAKVVQDEIMLKSVMDSYRRNFRSGIPNIEKEIKRNFRKL